MNIGILSFKTDIIIGEGTREFGMVLGYDCLFIFFRKWYIFKKRKTKREILEASFVDKYRLLLWNVNEYSDGKGGGMVGRWFSFTITEVNFSFVLIRLN